MKAPSQLITRCFANKCSVISIASRDLEKAGLIPRIRLTGDATQARNWPRPELEGIKGAALREKSCKIDSYGNRLNRISCALLFILMRDRR